MSKLTDLLSLTTTLGDAIRGIHQCTLRWDAMGPESATIRVDTLDWDHDLPRLREVAEHLLDPDMGDRIVEGTGFLNVHTSRGHVRCRSASVRMATSEDRLFLLEEAAA